MSQLQFGELGNRETIRANSQRGDEIIKISLDKIVIRDGFNVRTDYGDIQSLANSILENGQEQPGRVDVMKDGTFVLTDGHRRFKAMQLLREQGNEGLFKAIVNNSKTTEEQRILQMFTTQDNKPLLAHEVAELIRRLINLGHSQISIAKKIGKSAGYISQMLSFAMERKEIKDHVVNGSMSVSTALKLQKEIPNEVERVQVANEIIEKQRSSPKSSKKESVSAHVNKNSKRKKAELICKRICEVYDIDDKRELINIIENSL